jgi:16S rRNA (cytidine1402-2'-O)-methyltransferase
MAPMAAGSRLPFLKGGINSRRIHLLFAIGRRTPQGDAFSPFLLENFTADPGGIMTETIIGAAMAALTSELAKPLAAGLYLVATPIGNLTDISLRAIAVLARADHVYCEDTRHTQKLMAHYAIDARLSPYHEHNAARERPKILRRLADGAALALVSDAGTPLISDPGYKLVREAAAQGSPVLSIPGASAVLAALPASGLPTDNFFFGGFLPPREAALARRLDDLADIPATLILFETAARLDRALQILNERFAGRELVLCRELTKRFEEIIRSPLPAPDLRGRAWRGEFVLLLSPPLDSPADENEVNAALRDALARLSLRDAVEEVRRTLRVPRKQVYELALKFQRGGQDHDGE